MIKKLLLALCVNFFSQAMVRDAELRRACNDCRDGVELCCLMGAVHYAVVQRILTPDSDYAIPRALLLPYAVEYSCYLGFYFPLLMARGGVVFLRRCQEFVDRANTFSQIPEHMRME